MQKTRKHLMLMVRKKILEKGRRFEKWGIYGGYSGFIQDFIENVAKQMAKIHFFRSESKYDTKNKIG